MTGDCGAPTARTRRAATDTLASRRRALQTRSLRRCALHERLAFVLLCGIPAAYGCEGRSDDGGARKTLHVRTVPGLPSLSSAAVGATSTTHGSTIARENARAGSAAWRIDNPARKHEVEGYASLSSAVAGDHVLIHVSVDQPRSVHYELYRMGYYQGLGGRFISSAPDQMIDPQPSCPANAETGLVECAWDVAFDVTVDPSWVSGEYFFKLITDEGVASYVPLVVREAHTHAPLLFQSAVNTWQAYNTFGGSSLYRNSLPDELHFTRKHADAVSYDRPYTCQDLTADDCVPGAGNFELGEHWMIQWLEQRGIELSYVTNLDVDADGGDAQLLSDRKLFLVVGHDEYWPLGERSALEAARTAGVSLGFLSANTGYWRVRFEPSSRGDARRTIVCYKEGERDPNYDGPDTTTEFRSEPAARPEQSLIGVMYDDDISRTYFDGFAEVVTNQDHWLYEGTHVRNGDVLSHNIGYEWDRAFFDDSAPPGREIVAHAELFNVHGLQVPTDISVYYPTPGSLVFAVGSIYWSNALAMPGAQDARVSRMTENMLYRAGIRGFDLSEVPARAEDALPSAVVPIAGSGEDGQSDGPADQAQFGSPVALALGDQGEIYVIDQKYNAVRVISGDGQVTTLAGCGHKGSSDGQGNAACFTHPSGIARASDGTLYVTDSGNNRIRAISPAGAVTTIAGTGKNGTQDDSDPHNAKFANPRGIALAVDAQGAQTFYITDADGNNLRKLDKSGVSTLTGLNEPTGITVGADGAVYIVATRGGALMRYQAGALASLAGSEGHFGDRDGPANQALLRPADGIVLDGDRLVFTDSANHKLRALQLSDGSVSTLAGADGTTHDLQMPRAVVADADGYIVADTGNHRIVRVPRR